MQGVILSWLYGAVFKLRLYKPTARYDCVSCGFYRLRTYELNGFFVVYHTPVVDFTDCGLTSRRFAFARRVLILSRDVILRAVLRRIVDYPQHLRAAALFENI